MLIPHSSGQTPIACLMASLSFQEIFCLSQGFLQDIRAAVVSLNYSDLWPERTPLDDRSAPEKGKRGRAQHGREMSDAAVVAGEQAALREQGHESLFFGTEEDFCFGLLKPVAKKGEQFFLRRTQEQGEGERKGRAETVDQLEPESGRMVFRFTTGTGVKHRSPGCFHRGGEGKSLPYVPKT